MEKKDNTAPFKKKGPNAVKPIIVPYSKGNEEKKDPIPQNVFLTVGPLPVGMVAACISQMEEQKWTVRETLFGGFMTPGKIALQQPAPVPMYHVIICKIFHEGSEVVQPSLNFGPPSSGN